MVVQLLFFVLVGGFVLLALVLFIINYINKSQVHHLSDPPDIQPYLPGALCPSLVKIEIEGENNSTGVGFIVKSEEGLTTVWCQSWCLYDLDIYETKGVKVLRKLAKVIVVMQDKENFGRFYDGVVNYVDFDIDVAIILIKDRNNLIPLKELLPNFGNFIEKHILSCDFHQPFNAYSVEPYSLKSIEGDDDELPHKCGPYLHVDWKYWHTPGILLDTTNLNIVGMKFGICHSALSHSKELAHVLPIQEIVARLQEKSQSNYHTDIQPHSMSINDKAQDGGGDMPNPPWKTPVSLVHQVAAFPNVLPQYLVYRYQDDE